MSAGDALQPRLDRARALSLFGAVGGLAACAASGVLWHAAFFPAYLVAYAFWCGIAIGSICLLLLHNLTGGNWGLLIRRPLEAAAMTIVPMAVLFAPVALGMRDLYPWAHPEIVAENPNLQHKAPYLNADAFLLRAGVGFAIWIAAASLLHHGAIRSDGEAAPGTTRARWLPRLSGPGLAVVAFTASFAPIDWMMSREPTWYSSIYGVMVVIGWGLLTFATMILITGAIARENPKFALSATPTRVQDLGNLMLAFVMLWAYMSFSQFLIIWAGNLSEEIPWYLRRIRGPWAWVAVALVGFHFFAPFLALLLRDVKRNVAVLMVVAAAVVAMHLVDLSWLILPASPELHGNTPHVPWGSILLVPVAWVGIGGVAAWAFLWSLGRRPLLPDEIVVGLDHPLSTSTGPIVDKELGN